MIAIACSPRLRFAAASVLAGWLLCCMPSVTVESAFAAAPRALTFDLPEMPLKDALARFDALTHMSVFYPSSLVEGRRSRAVSGMYSPREALDELLEGTGVMAEATAQNAFVLAPLGVAQTQSDAARSMARAASDYHARLQGKVLQALCAAPSLSPGEYRLAMTVQVGANARVAQVRLLDSTGDSRRDAAIARRLQGLDVGSAPIDVSRPFVLLLVPAECRAIQPECERSPCQAARER
ncbi:STN domain-containing protein [Pandoraea bronchicola]|uniref:Ferripyoverdine receptor n=1 Tax=Pandoraea bronchicola TaxID=2508287 RepID=A0A5E5C0F5_9BURK|nr:STN domain-containing protein [Pandoraea bronchicola]VVE90715.1 Ferripyoverdine receptor [Pandoraea bronchicola]